MTSEQGKAIALSYCQGCRAPPDSLGDQCGQWTCKLGWNKIGDACFDPLQCPTLEGYSYAPVSGACVPSALPWQARGYQRLSLDQGVAVARENSTVVAPENARIVIEASFFYVVGMCIA